MTLNGYSAACNDVALCGTGPGLLLGIGESLDYSIGTARGESDLFSTRVTATGFNIDAFSRPIAGGIAIDGPVEALFLRITAVDDPISITAAGLSQNVPFAVFSGTLLTPELVPVPGPLGGPLLAGALGLGLMTGRKRRARRWASACTGAAGMAHAAEAKRGNETWATCQENRRWSQGHQVESGLRLRVRCMHRGQPLV